MLLCELGLLSLLQVIPGSALSPLCPQNLLSQMQASPSAPELTGSLPKAQTRPAPHPPQLAWPAETPCPQSAVHGGVPRGHCPLRLAEGRRGNPEVWPDVSAL